MDRLTRVWNVWIWSLMATSCTTPAGRFAEPLRTTGETWSPHTLCVPQDGSDDTLELALLVRAAVDEWRAAWPVSLEPIDECVPVTIVEESETAAWGEDVGRTRLRPGTWEPATVKIAALYWNDCPLSRWWLVLHEVGHAVGHTEHTLSGVMHPLVQCQPDDEPIVTDDDRQRALRRRLGQPL